ncbi:YitT family protein [Streptomyces sp. NPDC059637]|uniref:membrane protein YczE n=1 Tax=Streptomyces sp. NPDC059637 TaxID=3347752 RepID=UPI003677B858
MLLTRRLVRLYLGLVLYGTSTALQIRAGLGTGPWDVFHQGVAGRTGLSVGTVSVLTGACVLAAWIPLRQRPGLGTVSNVLVVGLSMDAALHLLPAAPEHPALRAALLVFGVVLNGAATGLYICARFGPGPRDGLMTGLHARTGRSVRLVRTGIELTVLAGGIALGGTAGIGTVLYALAIGPLAQFFLRRFALPEPQPRARAAAEAEAEAGAAPVPGPAADPRPGAPEPASILPG